MLMCTPKEIGKILTNSYENHNFTNQTKRNAVR
jgi:hypothetical protein